MKMTSEMYSPSEEKRLAKIEKDKQKLVEAEAKLRQTSIKRAERSDKKVKQIILNALWEDFDEIKELEKNEVKEKQEELNRFKSIFKERVKNAVDIELLKSKGLYD
jgi:hypothetical protein